MPLFFISQHLLQAQRFLALVLLPKVRQDIEDNKRCHFALFQAMKKATYKPDAFFKVPLPALALHQGHCLLRHLSGVRHSPCFSISAQACLGKLVAWTSIDWLACVLFDVCSGRHHLWPAWLVYTVNAVVREHHCSVWYSH